MRQPFTRRSFLKRTLGAAGAAAAAFPAIVPSQALGAGGAVAPSNRIVMGGIGVGSMGMGDLGDFLGRRECQVVAVCDVDRRHRENAKRAVDNRYQNDACKTYLDFRELIDRGDFNLVIDLTADQRTTKR